MSSEIQQQPEDPDNYLPIDEELKGFPPSFPDHSKSMLTDPALFEKGEIIFLRSFGNQQEFLNFLVKNKSEELGREVSPEEVVSLLTKQEKVAFGYIRVRDVMGKEIMEPTGGEEFPN